MRFIKDFHHAGDAGVLGGEEEDIIIPAIQDASDKGVLCYGPYPVDGFMGSGNYEHFDGILAMYHDQGLGPFKALAMDEGVNYTAGLPVVRTSPAHVEGRRQEKEIWFGRTEYSGIIESSLLGDFV